MSFDPSHLAALSAIFRLGSFDAAASSLNVTPSAISQRIKALEDRMGTALVQRGVPCEPTSAGARLAQHADSVALMEAHVLRDLRPDADIAWPKVRIAVNADSLATWFAPALEGVPDMLFDLVIDDQDHSADWLKRAEVSAAVTSQQSAATGCHVTSLGALRYVATARPDFVARWFADGVTAATLARAPLMTFNTKDQLQARWIRQVTGRSVAAPTHHLASTHGFIDAALAGIGWGMNPLPLVAPHISRGALVPLLPDQPLDVPLYWQVSRICRRLWDS